MKFRRFPIPRSRPDRRRVLLGLAASALATPAIAQATTPPKPAAPDLALSARPVAARLDDMSRQDSTLFRLLPESAFFDPTAETAMHRLRPNAEATIGISNRLSQPLSLGIRGLRGPVSTGKPVLAPGESGLISLPARQSGSFLVYPTTPGLVSEQTGRGLTSLMVIEEASPPPVDHDLPLLS
jgi:FtsP/CotA-like multicopper oxidase with cupredoxin domain